MPYKRLDVNELVKTISQANSVTNGWDVLCSYDLQALNRVLLEEYKKFPVNSQLNFFTNSTISPQIRETLDCNLKFDNPTLSFSIIESGIYNLKMPISNNSSCNQIIYYRGKIDASSTITIPQGHHMLISGPLQTLKDEGRNKTISGSHEIIEFGNSKQANITLHLGKDSKLVKILHDSGIQAQWNLQDLFTKIKNNFANNIKEVNYNIAQVVSKTDKLGNIVLTPKSFIITTMSDQNNTENGVLNIWIQTNESQNPSGNTQASFYPGSNVLPIPNGHSASVIFSSKLIQDMYFKPALEKNFNVTFSSINPYNNTVIGPTIGIVLVPKENSIFEKDFSYRHSYHGLLSSSTREFRCTKLQINFQNNPFWLVNNEIGDLTITWHWSQEFILHYSDSSTSMGGNGFHGGESKYGHMKVKIDMYSPLLKEVINNHVINVTLNINQTNITISREQLDDQHSWTDNIGLALYNFNATFPTASKQIDNTIISHLKAIKINFGSLNYFAEANILFHEEKFKVVNDNAIYFSGDTIVIGNIETQPDANQMRHKRHYHHDQQLNPNAHAINHISTESSEFINSSANNIKSPINTAIHWLSNSFTSKFLSPANIMTNYGFIKDGIQNIQSLFAKSEHLGSDNSKSDNVTSINIGQFDVNSSLTLANFIIRYFAKVKPYNIKEEPIDLLGVKAYVLNIITRFEEILNDPSIQSYLPVETLEFDPVVLISKLEKAVINGNYTEIEKILHRSIVNNNYHLDDTQFSSDIQDKINEMLAQQNTEYSYNQQLISDYSSNNHTTVEDMSNILVIENDINHTNHQSEVNLIG